MKIFQTQADFLKAFPIKDGFINLEYNSVTLLFNLDIPRINIINAKDINARNINARDINAWNIYARDIKAWDINARDIKAQHIIYYAVCFAYTNITCKSIAGIRGNAKHFCLDGKITIEA